MAVNIKMIISELYKAFHIFNKEYYNNSLPEPSLLIQNRGNKKNVLGWCTTKKIWNDFSTNDKKYEIAIISEYLNRGMLPVLATLLHEMTHLHNLVNGIKDVTRSGTYHNKRFKEVAECHGLLVEHDKSIGWSITRLQSSTINFIKTTDLKEEVFTLVRLDPMQLTYDDEDEEGGEGGEEKAKSSSRKYVCPKCETIIRATKEVNVICGDCKVAFELEP
jgi:hypothetical protein